MNPSRPDHNGFVATALVVAAAAMFLGASAAVAAPMVYNFDTTVVSSNPTGNPAQSDTVLGTITTDGTIGVLAAANILSWNLALIDNLNGANSFTLTTGNSTLVELNGSALTATASDLLFDFSSTGEFLIQANNPGAYSGSHYFCFSTGVFACLRGETISPAYVYADGAVLTGNGVPAGAVPLAPPANPPGGSVPVPSSLALAGLALFAAGAQRRRRA